MSMKALDIAFKDVRRAFRSAIGVVFMFAIPLGVTGMFYFMFGNIAGGGDFDLPRTNLVVANLDRGGPRLELGSKSLPEGIHADTLGELVVEILKSDELADLLAVNTVPNATSARAAVDNRQAQVAVIIPANFSQQFADLYGQAAIEFYQDPTLTIGPGIVKSVLNQFMDRIAAVKIGVDVAQEQIEPLDPLVIGQVVQGMLDTSTAQSEDLAGSLLEVRAPRQSATAEQASTSPLVAMIGPIMGGMMIFYAFYTGSATAQSILREEEERTLPRLFTTPTPQATILTGKFLAVFLTVLVQMSVLLVAARLIFKIDWGDLLPVFLIAAGIVLVASSFGIFINSMLKTTKQGGVIFGGVLTMTGMIGMIGIFAIGSPTAARLSNTVSLLVPQGWAVRGLLQSMHGDPVSDVLLTFLVMLGWGLVFFAIGVWRFNRRYT
jgi:ABC-type transport system involved in multi-copper enzyme maturation permease subunit